MRTLDLDGTYSVLVDPKIAATGGLTVQLYTVPADVTGPIVSGGASVAVSTATPGQNARLTFSAGAGQRVSVKIAGSTYTGGATVSILNPDGVTSAGSFTLTSATGFLEPKTLRLRPAPTRCWSIPRRSPPAAPPSRCTRCPPIDPGSITIGGASAASFPVPGQNARLTFTGTTKAERSR